MPDNRNLDLLKGFLIGSLIGAVAGILLAPKSGKELRGDIGRKAEDLLARAKEEYEATLEKSKKAYEAAVERIKDMQAAARKKAADVEQWTEKGKETIVDTGSRFKKAVDAGIEAFKEEKA